jgi:DNA-binding IclR family transcriptional regulator
MEATGLPAALSRSALLLEAAARGDGLLFQDAIAALGTVPSTVSRLLRALTAADLLVHGDDGRYRAAPRLHRLAAVVAGAPDLATEAAATVESASAATGESAAVFVPVDEGVQILAKRDLDERFRFMPVGGINYKVHSHGVNILRAAYWDEATAKRRFAAAAPGENPAAWLRRLKVVRREGWIANDVDDQPGIGRIAAAVLDAKGEAIAFVAVAGTAAALSEKHDQILREVRAAAAALSARMGRKQP